LPGNHNCPTSHAARKNLGHGELLEAIRGQGVHRVLTGITLPNAASVRLHERFGFTEIGVEHEVGWKFDQYWDVLRVERAVD
jgi:phosphinothricin acetyltransferase